MAAYMVQKRSISLCSTYILPLIGLNRFRLGDTNFINSYLNEDGTHVVVELKIVAPIIKKNPFFKFDFKDGEKVFAVFQIPTEFLETVQLFIKGKYSAFPEEAKKLIRDGSGLPCNVQKPNGKKFSAREILALERHPGLREALENELSNPGSPVRIEPTAELMDIPGEDNFYILGLSNSLNITVKEE